MAVFFPGEPGLAGLLELRMMEVVVTTGAISRAKIQSNRHHQQTNTRCPSCRPSNTLSILTGIFFQANLG